MSVVFDATTGHLRLDPEAFIGLLDYATEPEGVCDEVVARLHRAGAVSDGRPHPLLRNALAAVTSSLGSLQVLVSTLTRRLNRLTEPPVSVTLDHDLVCFRADTWQRA